MLLLLTEETSMVAISKIVGVLLCGFVLGLGLSTVTQAAEKPPAAER